MRIVLHIGQGKTGTTALQRSLAAAREHLLAQGIWYPRATANSSAHHVLTALFLPPEHLAFHVIRDNGGLEQAQEHARQFYQALKEQVRRDPPEVLLLSSETFAFRKAGPQALVRLHEVLAELSSDIEPVVYVREPAAHFLSSFQEFAKTASRPHPPEYRPCRALIETAERVFSRPARIGVYDRKLLVGGDITQDFLQRIFAGRVNLGEAEAETANVSISAEAMSVIIELRAILLPDREGRNDPLTWRLMNILREEDQKDYVRPRLRPEIAAAIRRAAVDHRWLVEERGLAIPGYDPMVSDGTPIPPEMATLPIEGIIEIDQDRRDRLAEEVLHRILSHLPDGSGPEVAETNQASGM